MKKPLNLPFIIACFLFAVSQFSHARSQKPIVVAFDNPPTSGDPRFITWKANDQYLEDLRFLSLVSYDKTGGLRYVLAKKIKPHGPKGWNITIHKGVKFANGKEITVDDVLATFKRIQDKSHKKPSPRFFAFADVSKFERKGKYSFNLILKEANVAYLKNNLVVGILPKKLVENAPEDLFRKGAESGPYVLQKKSDNKWVLAPNKHYSAKIIGRKTPKNKGLEIRFIKDDATRLSTLLKKEIDLMQNGVEYNKIKRLKRKYSSQFDFRSKANLQTTSLAFNMQNKYLKNPKVRRAIAKAINRKEMLKYLMHGYAEKANSMFPRGHPFYHSKIALINFDPKAAKRLLDAAGYRDPDGKGPKMRFSLSIKTTNSRNKIRVAKAIASRLRQVGIDAKVEGLEWKILKDDFNKGNVDMWLQMWSGFKDPDHLHYAFHSSMFAPKGGNRGRYKNVSVDNILDKARTQHSEKKRRALYNKAQMILSRDLPYVFLWHTKHTLITKKGVKGFKIYADGRYSSLSQTHK